MGAKSPFHILLLLAAMALLLVVDFEAGPLIHFSPLFLFPVGIAAWFGGLFLGLVAAVGIAVLHAALALWQEQSVDFLSLGVNTTLEIAVFAAAAFIASHLAAQSRRQATAIEAVSGFFSICSFCKKLRPPGKEWVPVDEYLRDHTRMHLSHGVCPECAGIYYGKYLSSPVRDRLDRETGTRENRH